MGVVVRRYIDILTIIINFPYSTCISSFMAAASYFFVHFLNVLRSCFCYFFTIYSKCYSKNIRDRSKKIDHANIIIPSTARARASPETSTCGVPNDV